MGNAFVGLDPPAVSARLRAGDRALLDRLVDAFADPLYRIAHAALGDTAAAADVVSEVLGAHALDADAAARATGVRRWLLGLACAAALERAGDSADPPGPLFGEDGHRLGTRSFVLFDWSRSSEDADTGRRRQAITRQTISRLPARLRLAHVLHAVEGLDYTDVADIMATTVAGVRRDLHRVHLAVREELTRSEMSP
jgi:DNA-directed RNA polymerase specialized sigma24 family protein